MTALLPWIAFLLASALFLFRVGFSGKSVLDRLKESSFAAMIPLLFGVVALIVGWRMEPRFHGLFHLALGTIVGSLALWATHLVDSEDQRPWRPAYAIVFATAAVALTHWFKELLGIEMSQYGVIIGAVLMAFTLSVGKEGVIQQTAVLGSIIAGVLVACDNIGRQVGPHSAAQAGLLLGLSAAIATVGSTILLKRDTENDSASKRFAWTAAVAIIIVAGGFLAAKYIVFRNEISWMVVGGVVIALVTHWLLSENASNTLRYGIAAATWIAGATLAFAEIRVIGMTVFMVSGVMMLVALQNSKVILSMGPVIGLVFYRLFREAYPEASRGLDLGQHYAMIGLISGLLLTLIAVEWLQLSHERMWGKGLFAAGIWIILLIAIPIVGTLLLGPKGVTGYIVGLGMAALIEGFKDAPNITVASIGIGLASLMAALYRWVLEFHSMTRTEKIAIVGRYALDIIALAVLLMVLSSVRKRRSE
jgi:hypothetical protein